MKANIEEKFANNLGRVKNLLNIYRLFLAGDGQGRRGYSKTDVLRAAVVLLHASMEDLLRSLAAWKFPNANAELLGKVPLATVAPKDKFSLGELIAYRGKTVDEVINESVEKALERSNYNNVEELAKVLSNLGVDVDKVNKEFSTLDEMMKRRHQIVHRADRTDARGQGRHKVTSLGQRTVGSWVRSVQRFGDSVLKEIPD